MTHVDGAFGEVEALLDQQGQLADAAAVLAQHVGSAGGVDDHLGARGRGADLEAGVAAPKLSACWQTHVGLRTNPSSESSRVKNSFNSALKIPSAINCLKRRQWAFEASNREGNLALLGDLLGGLDFLGISHV